MISAGMFSCVIAVQFCPQGLVLHSFVTLAFAPSCPGKYTYSQLRIQCDRYQGEVTHVRLPRLPLYLHFAQTCLLIACFAVNWYLPSILNIAYQQAI